MNYFLELNISKTTRTLDTFHAVFDQKCQKFPVFFRRTMFFKFWYLTKDPNRLPKWYFGGLASTMSVCVTHPLDLLKVQLQTQQGGKVTLVELAKNILKQDGVPGLYNGLSAAILRQMTYSTLRFAIYDMVKIHLGKDTSFATRVGVAGFSGGAAAVFGVPADKVNVRMQNDGKLPKDQRKNYKHAIDGLWRIYKQEGFKYLFSGTVMASLRATVMAIGQLAFYDQIKIMILKTPYFDDNLSTHFTASMGAAGVATMMTQPLDVLKTRIMNAKPGEFKGISDAVVYTAKDGPQAFFKGFIPAFLRLGPQTIIMFVFYEQLRQYFGTDPKPEK